MVMIDKKKLSPLQKIHKINQKIEKLKQQSQNVQKTFETKITNLLKKEKAYHHDFTILYGAILDICQKMNRAEFNEETLKRFQTLGQSILEKKKNKKNETL